MNRRQLFAVAGALLAGSLAGCVGQSGTDDGGTTDDGATDDGAGSGTGNDQSTPSDDDSNEEDADSDADSDAQEVDEKALAELVRETNGFTFDIYRQLLAESPDGNLFASPVSISVALAMAYAGARDETRQQMRDVMRYTLEDDDLHAAFGALRSEFNDRGASECDADESGDGSEGGDTSGEGNGTDGGTDTTDQDGGGSDEEEPVPFELSLVNSVWGQEDYPFRQAYLDLLATYYGGDLREVDFTNDAEGAREEINEWVADQTEDRIEELLPENSLDPMTRLVLVNAIYFLANWEHQFVEGGTETDTFAGLDGAEHDVQMMSQNSTLPYAELDGAQAVQLPYVGGETSMLVILPPEGEFESYEESLDRETLTALVDALEAREGQVKLPRFEFDSGFMLSRALQEMGMVDAFDAEAADLGGIAPLDELEGNLYIDEAYHEAFVAVDEQGTEAAAATGVVVGVTSAPQNPFEFVADRPFLFAIRDHPTDAVLFLGRAVDPTDWDDPAESDDSDDSE